MIISIEEREKKTRKRYLLHNIINSNTKNQIDTIDSNTKNQIVDQNLKSIKAENYFYFLKEFKKEK